MLPFIVVSLAHVKLIFAWCEVGIQFHFFSTQVIHSSQHRLLNILFFFSIIYKCHMSTFHTYVHMFLGYPFIGLFVYPCCNVTFTQLCKEPPYLKDKSLIHASFRTQIMFNGFSKVNFSSEYIEICYLSLKYLLQSPKVTSTSEATLLWIILGCLQFLQILS